MTKSVNGGNKGVINAIYAVIPKGWKVILLKFLVQLFTCWNNNPKTEPL